MLLGKLRNMDLEHNYPRQHKHSGPMVSVIYSPTEKVESYIIKTENQSTRALSVSRIAVAGSKRVSVPDFTTLDCRSELDRNWHELRYNNYQSLYSFFPPLKQALYALKSCVLHTFGAPFSGGVVEPFIIESQLMLSSENTPPSNLEKDHEKTKHRRN